MESEELFKKLDQLLIDEEDGFLAKIRSLGFFDENQFKLIINLISEIPTVIDKSNCVRINRAHLDSFLSLMPVLIDGQTHIIDPKVRMQIETGIAELLTTLLNALYDELKTDESI